MKTGYLVGAVVITVILLITVFQNFKNDTAFEMFFSFDNVSTAFPILLLAVLGMVAGSLYTIAIKSVLEKKKTQEKEEEL